MPNSVDLGKKLEAVVAALVAQGRYNSKSEVLREGVRLVEEREKRLKLLDSAIAQGIAEADKGHGKSLDEAFDGLKKKIARACPEGPMNVVIMPRAEADLLAIGLWIAEDHPERAETFVDELREICRGLADAPKGYPLVERYKSLGIRRRSYRNYLIFYRIGYEFIEVVHVLHGARDYEAILSSDFE